MSTNPSTETGTEMAPQVATCLCGQISYEITGKPKFGSLCHCANCKKWSGTSFSWIAFFSTSQVHFTKGEALLKTYEDSATTRNVTVQRKFCPNCGSPMISTLLDNADICGVMAGAIDGDIPESWKPVVEVYCKDRAGWLPEMGLRSHDTVPAGYKKE